VIKTILFDVDGVFLSEERYFDASALTVWELLFSPKYLGLPGEEFTPQPKEETIRRVRELIFANDDVLNFIKSRGINSNWDMVYLTFSYHLLRVCQELQDRSSVDVTSLIANQIDRQAIETVRSWVAEHKVEKELDYASFTPAFAKGAAQKAEMLLYLNTLAKEFCGVETDIFSRNSELWTLCQETFQEWYLGDDLVSESIGRETVQPGKKGFLKDEIAIVEPEKVRELLGKLKDKGLRLGIGTGRPSIETHVPLNEMGILPFFEENRVVTASHVLDAETLIPEKAPLSKPHPYCYVKGYFGLETPDAQVLETPLPLPNAEEILIVGDSLADYLAARSIGCKFAATLTGLSGQEARAKFEEEKADYILNDVSEILSIFE